MDKESLREQIKSQFKYYLFNVARSARRTSEGFNLGKTAVDSFMSFLEVNRLFDYNPEKWSHIESMYDITNPEEVKQIADNLLNDKAFIKHDNEKNQGWRSGAISHYVCFINARSFFRSEKNETNLSNNIIKQPLQQIFYGAPGTGKSHKIKDDADVKAADGKNLVFRTTFHPDSDYSTFVGCYKPTKAISKRLQRMNLSLEDLARELGSYYSSEEFGKIGGIQKFCFEYYPYIDGEYMRVNVAKLLELAGVPKDYNVEINKYIKFCHLLPKQEQDRITYEFVPQAFLQAYVAAWNNPDDKVFLVIEEINRGNCAQIFGDLFQLLDRDDNGASEYPIMADKDIAKYLNGNDEEGRPVLTNKDGIKDDKLRLPKNLHIWATMNTSDQSLFPIDSAFKRRWDWNYMPIANEGKGWTIEIGKNTYDWWEFLDKINTKIEDATYSEDKKLGYFFCKAKDGVIDAKTFVGKVLFYLWNDVFKDTDFADSLLKDEDGKKSFDKFYTPIGQGNAEIVTSRIIEFMKRVGVEPIPNFNSEEDEEDEDGKSHVRYSIDGDIFKRKSYAGKEIMSRYLKGHPNLTFQEIKDTFPDSMLVHSLHRGLIASADTPLDSYGRYYSPEQFTSSDGVTFRIYKQWTEANINNIINFAKSQGWNIKVFEESDGSGE